MPLSYILILKKAAFTPLYICFNCVYAPFYGKQFYAFTI